MLEKIYVYIHSVIILYVYIYIKYIHTLLENSSNSFIMRHVYHLFVLGIILSINLQNLNANIITEPSCQMNKNCFLPKCNCESTHPPVNLALHYNKDEIPQLVILTIDDDKLNTDSYKVYKKLFENIRNPNNQPIKATIFLSDSENRTSFCLVRNLYEQMHEIAISTVNYTCPHRFCNVNGPSFRPWKYETWIEQILNMRERLNMYAGIPKSDINGFRAPLLEPASDMHYRIILGNKFLYDSSLVVSTDDLTEMSWPFTLDYKLNFVQSNNGPIEKYQGLWEMPLPIFIGHNNGERIF